MAERSGTQFCLSCGVPDIDAAESCPHCGVAVGIGPPEAVREGDILIGRMSQDGHRLEALAFRSERSEFRFVGVDGREVSAKSKPIRSFRPVRGLQGTGSLAAALLLARTQLIDGPADDESWTTLIASVINGNIPRARRAATSLGTAGVPALIPLLPLSTTEKAWWTAIAHVRRGDAALATQTILTLPRPRYPDALPLLASLNLKGTARNSSSAAAALESLSAADLEEVMRSSGSWNLNAAEDAWLHNGSLTPPAAAVGSAATLYAMARGATPSSHERVQVPASTPLTVLDDLIDRGLRVEITAIDQLPAADQQYLLARTRPQDLDLKSLMSLEFHDEIARRDLLNGEPVSVELSSISAARVREAAAFTDRWNADPSAEWHAPPQATEIRQLVSAPGPDALTPGALADTSLWPYLHRQLPSEVSSWSAPRGSAASRFLAWCALRNATSCLYDAKWDAAATEARHVLRLTDDESLRDEALNVIAYTCWQSGNDDAAQKALTAALEGSRNVALQVNLGIIAADLEPEAAALELARLVRESPTLELRAAAALRATNLWLTDELPWDSDADDGMPPDIRDALRSIVAEPVPLDTFRQIVRVQANLDRDWLSGPRSLDQSPHRSTVEAKVYLAKAAGPQELVDALVVAMRDPERPSWLVEERDSLIRMVTSAAFDDPSSSAALFALSAIEKGLPVEPRQHALIVPLAVHAVCDMLDPGEAEPADKFDKLMADAERQLKAAGEYEELAELYDSAWSRLVLARVLYASTVLDKIIDAYNRGHAQVAGIPRFRLNMSAVRSAFWPLRDAAREIAAGLMKLPRSRAKSEVQEFLDSVVESANEVQRRVNEITR